MPDKARTAGVPYAAQRSPRPHHTWRYWHRADRVFDVVVPGPFLAHLFAQVLEEETQVHRASIDALVDTRHDRVGVLE